MKLKSLLILFLTICVTNINAQSLETSEEKESKNNEVPNRIKVLNFGTFHMGYTSDARKVDFDEKSDKNRKDVHEIAKELAKFKPTIIVIEALPEKDSIRQADYMDYLKNPDKKFANPDERELLAYEVGRLSGAMEIYGIDHKMGYNYRIGQTIENHIDSITYNQFYKKRLAYFPSVNYEIDSLSLKGKLITLNKARFLDYLITVNADVLTFAGTKKGFEGADEAAKYYQRNLRMFSNLNRIEMDENDRVFILMGASHTAFFRDFISRSPKYEMVNTSDYLE